MNTKPSHHRDSIMVTGSDRLAMCRRCINSFSKPSHSYQWQHFDAFILMWFSRYHSITHLLLTKNTTTQTTAHKATTSTLFNRTRRSTWSELHSVRNSSHKSTAAAALHSGDMRPHTGVMSPAHELMTNQTYMLKSRTGPVLGTKQG